MPTTWFFDAAGTGSECRVLVLSAVGGSDVMWDKLNFEWKAALPLLGIDVWHSTDYFRTSGRAEKPRMPLPLLNVIGQHVLSEFNCFSFAVDKAAAKAARSQHPQFVPTDVEMLLWLCFRGVGSTKEDQNQPGRIKILFDKGEPFIDPLKKSWQAGRKELRRRGSDGWPLQVSEIEPASSKKYPGLQVADLISWSIRCRYEYGDKMIDPKIPMIMLPFLPNLRGGFLDLNTIRALYVERSSPDLRHSYNFA